MTREYAGRYHLIDTAKNLELFDAPLLIDCWTRLSLPTHVITRDDGEIVAGHAEMLQHVMASPSVYLKDLTGRR